MWQLINKQIGKTQEDDDKIELLVGKKSYHQPK
jgi:hypothetical protein